MDLHSQRLHTDETGRPAEKQHRHKTTKIRDSSALRVIIRCARSLLSDGDIPAAKALVEAFQDRFQPKHPKAAPTDTTAHMIGASSSFEEEAP